MIFVSVNGLEPVEWQAIHWIIDVSEIEPCHVNLTHGLVNLFLPFLIFSIFLYGSLQTIFTT